MRRRFSEFGKGNKTILEESYGDDAEEMEMSNLDDPDDPYLLNQIDKIPHDHLKELYTGLVDQLLDLQLECDEKVAEAEKQALIDLDM